MYRLIILLLLIFSHSAIAENNRHALIVGNSSYASKVLKNPANDAIDMAVALQALGFKIHKNTALYDLNHEQFSKEIDAFSAGLPPEAIALVYYAGHGISWRGDNYFIPVDTALTEAAQLQTNAISLSGIMSRLSRSNPSGLNLYFLDACRDNPLATQLTGNNYGLIRLEDIPHGSFVGYAAQEGQVASDGAGRNGLYTAQLLFALREHPEKQIMSLHNVVKHRVFKASKKSRRRQTPMEVSTITREFCFSSCDVSFRTIEEVPPVRSGESTAKNYLLYVALGSAVIALLLNAQGDDSGEVPDTLLLNLIPPEQ